MESIFSKFFYTLIILLGVNLNCFCQFNWTYNDSIIVIKGSDTLSAPWSGGLNHPQFSTIDLDFDGVEELIAFEPENNQISVFRRKNVNGKLVLKYWHKGETVFPSDINSKLKLVDYDGDGKKDIFTAVPGGLKVYKNISTPTTGIQWQVVANPVIVHNVYSGLDITLYAADNVIPAYYDVDHDGDLDILTYAMHEKRVIWNKNISMETYGNADSLKFEDGEQCWGDFTENSTGNGIDLNSTLSPCGTSPIPPVPDNPTRHVGGGSMLALDVNGDQLTDLIIGDHEFNNLTLVVNGGVSADTAKMVSVDNQFPVYNTPVDISNYPTAYFEDVDLDGIKDLLISSTETTLKTSDNTSNIWFYKNIGTNTNPNFSLQTKTFLQDVMIENGTGSIPVLVDVDNDGLQDLLVANDFNYIDNGATNPNSSRINYYRNIGTLSKPVFKWVTNDWKSFSISGFTARVAPAFGDLDGDGDLDMIIGLKNGKLYYYQNAGGSGPMNFNIVQTLLTDNLGNNISVATTATPELFDLDKDGKLDLIIGQGSGSMLYYRNVGTTNSFTFALENNDLGGNVVSSQQAIVPRFVRDNNITYLFAGNSNGTLLLYDSIDYHIQAGDSFHLISSNYLNINTKMVSALAISQIRNDNSYDLFVGGQLGGLWHFAPGDTSVLAMKNLSEGNNEPGFSIYPNPNRGSFNLQMNNYFGEMYSYKIYDQYGRVISETNNLNQAKVRIQLSHPQVGVYFIELTQSNKIWVSKIVVE